MRTIIKYLLFISALSPLNSIQAQWYQVNSGTSHDIADMYFLTDLNGYAVGTTCIMKTSDGGENWNLLIQDTSLVYDLSIVTNSDSVFCFGQDNWGTMYKWTIPHNSNTCTKTKINYLPLDPVWFDNDIWFVNNGLSKYNNGNPLPVLPGVDNFYVKNACISASTATHIFTSYDAGLNWQSKQFSASSLTSAPYQSHFNGGDTLLAVTNYPTVVHYSFDGGLSWNFVHTTDGLYFNIIDARYFIALNFFSPNTKIYKTINTGQSFTYDSVANPVSKCYFQSEKNGFVYGKNGVIYKTSSGGGLSNTVVTTDLRNKISISPNPAKESIKIELKEGIVIKKIMLYDIQGKLVKEFNAAEKLLKINDLPPGQCFLYFETNKGTLKEKLIIE